MCWVWLYIITETIIFSRVHFTVVHFMSGKKETAFSGHWQGSHKIVAIQENVLYDHTGYKGLLAAWGLVKLLFTAIKKK